MRKQILTAFALCAVTLSFGQNIFKQNDVYLEVGGNGIVASLNYERQLRKQPGLGFRLGVGIVPMVGLSIPAGINYLIKTKNENSFIETGFGITYLLSDQNKTEKLQQINFVPSVGYRRHTSKNSLFRISFTPIFNESFVFPLVGVSFGKRF